MNEMKKNNTDQIGGDHYSAEIQPIDVMKCHFTKDQYFGFLWGNVIKYILRFQRKNGKEDLMKAKWYIEKMIGEMQ